MPDCAIVEALADHSRRVLGDVTPYVDNDEMANDDPHHNDAGHVDHHVVEDRQGRLVADRAVTSERNLSSGATSVGGVFTPPLHRLANGDDSKNIDVVGVVDTSRLGAHPAVDFSERNSLADGMRRRVLRWSQDMSDDDVTAVASSPFEINVGYTDRFVEEDEDEGSPINQ